MQAANWIPKNEASTIGGQLHPTKTAELLLIVVLFLFCCGSVDFTYKLYFVFGWTTYKEMGADVEVRSKFIRMTLPFLNLC
jgi:hypothetical protein